MIVKYSPCNYAGGVMVVHCLYCAGLFVYKMALGALLQPTKWYGHKLGPTKWCALSTILDLFYPQRF